jgi:hypothetical protein
MEDAAENEKGFLTRTFLGELRFAGEEAESREADCTERLPQAEGKARGRVSNYSQGTKFTWTYWSGLLVSVNVALDDTCFPSCTKVTL